MIRSLLRLAGVIAVTTVVIGCAPSAVSHTETIAIATSPAQARPLGELSAEQSAKIAAAADRISRLSIAISTLAMTEPGLFVYGCEKLDEVERLAKQIEAETRAWKEESRTADLLGAPQTCSNPRTAWGGISPQMLRANPLDQ